MKILGLSIILNESIMECNAHCEGRNRGRICKSELHVVNKIECISYDIWNVDFEKQQNKISRSIPTRT